MNKQRRLEVTSALSLLNAVLSRVQTIQVDEQMFNDNIPDNLRGSATSTCSDVAVEALELAVDALESAVDALESIY